MANTLEYIEDYFTGNLSEEEKAAFEAKCETDPSFAEEVAFYISVRSNLREELYTEKKKRFDDLYVQLSSREKQSGWSSYYRPVVKLLKPYFLPAAACLLLVLGWMFIFNDPIPQQLASNYIEDNLQTLSIPMNDSQDSLQLGIAAFNQQDYPTAEKILRSLTNKDNLAPEAVRNLGILYLVTDEYDKALLEFDALSAYKTLRANPGPFYKAVTLMKRDEGNDLEEAEKILQEVKEQQLPGSKEAEKWIEKF